jgi:predicted MFS family arabinose efflux permease
MERVRESDCLFASSILIFCYNTAWTFSTQVGGWVIENYGFRWSFIAAATFYLGAVGCYWLFFKRSNAKIKKIAMEPIKEAA